jgi:membrane protein implicated in regulation of membrane protease activity
MARSLSSPSVSSSPKGTKAKQKNKNNIDHNNDHRGQEEAPFFSRARFGPGMISIFAILVAILLVLLFYLKLYYFAIVPALVVVLLFTVKYFETIKLHSAEERKLVGQKCLVIKKVARNARGLVRVYRDNGELDSELWSAELSDKEEDASTEIGENIVAKVVGMKSIVLLIERESA